MGRSGGKQEGPCSLASWVVVLAFDAPGLGEQVGYREKQEQAVERMVKRVSM